MSRFTEAIAAEPTSQTGGQKCHTGHFQRSLTGEDRKDFDALLNQAVTGGRTWASVSRILARVDVKLAPKALNTHAKGDCRCPK